MDNKLTTSSDETPIADLFSGDLVFGIPYFQRPYKWKKENIERFEEDLLSLVDIDDTSHFLGAIIIFGKQTAPSDPKYYEVIDGQQRLTTCYLSLMAIAKVFLEHGEVEEAVGLYQRYIAIGRKTKNITNAKLISCKEDRAGMNSVFSDLLNTNSDFGQTIGPTQYYFKKMPDTGAKTGTIWKNYKRLTSFFEDRYAEDEKQGEGRGIEAINTLYAKLTQNMSVVQIVVKNPTDGPKIFDSLNSKQEPMTTGDLVRNEVFSNFSSMDDDEMSQFDSVYWHPFYERFNQTDNAIKGDKAFEQYFFPYVLILDHTVKSSEAFAFLRNRWADKGSPKEIIDDLKQYQDVYLDLYFGKRLTPVGPELQGRINRLSRMNTPTSVYPFVMKAVRATIDGVATEEAVVDILERIESFLVRRVTCGYEPTGLHAVFKSLWNDCAGDYSVENVVAIIKSHSTVAWPDETEFAKAIQSRPLYKARITPYLLEEWNAHLGGDIPKLENAKQIEHVLPEKPAADSQWVQDWSKEDRETKTSCLANLLPLSAPINSSLQNADYSKKKKRYEEDSALKSPREFAKEYDVWTPDQFYLRATKLKDWALFRWKY